MGDISKDINSRFPNTKLKALVNILYSASWITSFQNEFFKPYGISPQQFNILKILNGANQPLRVHDIKEIMIERSPNATRLMDKLSDKFLIERTPCPEDRRVVHIEITAKGKELLNSIPDNFNDELIKNITEEDGQKLSDLLDKMR